MNKLVSIIIPSYNREKTIKRSINSLLQQTYKNIEIIIVDDCSSDNTEEVVKKMDDDRISYYKLKENSGACFARNYGINKSRGEYIAFQDSDDMWENDKLQKQIEVLKKNNYDMVTCKIHQIDEETERVIGTIPNNINESRLLKFDEIIEKNCISTPVILAKSECVKDIMFDDEMPRFQDWDFALRFLKKYSIYFLNEVLFKQYCQKESITKNPQRGIDAYNILLKKYESEFHNNKKALANVYIAYAALKKKNNEKYINYLMKGLQTHFSIRNLLRTAKYIFIYKK